MSGIYILNTADGYRVAYSEDYDCLYGRFNDDTMQFDVNREYLYRIFGNSDLYLVLDDAKTAAVGLSKNYDETDDGIMVIKNYNRYTFEELLNGKANKEGKD